jgi:hypothetical protein
MPELAMRQIVISKRPKRVLRDEVDLRTPSGKELRY